MIEDIDRDVFVRIQTDLLVVGDSIITNRHHSSNGNYEDDDPQNQIGGIIPAFPLSGWLRHGMERVVTKNDGTTCHPGESNANFMKEDVYERDLDDGYHEKGACVEDPKEDDGCVVFDLFGSFGNQPGKVTRGPIKFNPVRSSVDYTRRQAEGHYRRLNRNIVSRNREDNREPLRNAEIDTVVNLDACWYLSFREVKPEFIGLLAEGIDFLDGYKTDFMHQLGGARNFGRFACIEVCRKTSTHAGRSAVCTSSQERVPWCGGQGTSERTRRGGRVFGLVVLDRTIAYQ